MLQASAIFSTNKAGFRREFDAMPRTANHWGFVVVVFAYVFLILVSYGSLLVLEKTAGKMMNKD